MAQSWGRNSLNNYSNVVGRARPSITDNGFNFHPFTVFNDNYHPMPSGHTTSAMALSTVMSRHAHSTALNILAYAPAAFTMFSLIYQDNHWLSDIVPAAAIGYFVESEKGRQLPIPPGRCNQSGSCADDIGKLTNLPASTEKVLK